MTDNSTFQALGSEAAGLAIAGHFVDALVAHDFDELSSTVGDDARFRALLPHALVEGRGPDAVHDAFNAWFGNASAWEVTEAEIGEVAGRIHLNWRIQLERPVNGSTPEVVEQQAYASLEATGKLGDIALVCSGIRPRGS